MATLFIGQSWKQCIYTLWTFCAISILQFIEDCEFSSILEFKFIVISFLLSLCFCSKHYFLTPRSSHLYPTQFISLFAHSVHMFPENVLLCSFSWWRTHYVDNTGLELARVLLPLPSKYWDCWHLPPGICHKAPFLTDYSFLSVSGENFLRT